MQDIEAEAKALFEKRNSYNPFPYRVATDERARVLPCAFRIEAHPVGGKADGQPSNAVFYLVRDTFDEETGEKTGARPEGFALADENGRTVCVSWDSAAKKADTARTWNRVEEAARAAGWLRHLRGGEGIPKEAKRPYEIEALMAETIALLSRFSNGAEVDRKQATTTAKTIRPDLAPWMDENGDFLPPPKKKTPAKKTAKK
tara:strand:+ start:2635 stop:3240 length:606 start_codon:yes stop_codon:yes gene_type:complete